VRGDGRHGRPLPLATSARSSALSAGWRAEVTLLTSGRSAGRHRGGCTGR
jgi:hypothetical protein